MKRIDSNLPNEDIVEMILRSESLIDFINISGLGLQHRRDKYIFKDRYGVDIMELIKNNNKIFSIVSKQMFDNQIIVCDNCEKSYRNGDRLKENKSGRHFCSDYCSHRFSQKQGNTEEINKKRREVGRKNKGFLLRTVNGYVVSSNIKERYLKNPKKCEYCGEVISYDRRNCKTCCKEHGRLLNSLHNRITQSIRHSSGGYRESSGRGKKGWYKGYYCDSTWELAYVIYNLEHNIVFERNREYFEYYYNGKMSKYFPDFIQDGKYVEIKGYKSDRWKHKLEQFPSDKTLIVLYKNEMKLYLSYVISKYGKEFYKLYEKHWDVA